MVSYLANTIRTQMELSNRLATAQLTLGGEGANAETGGGQRGGQRGKGGRGGQQRNQERTTEEARA